MPSIEPRIVNGSKAKRGSLSWMVSIYLQPNLKVNRNDHICGGAIISTKFILTAAHCLLKRYLPKQFSIRYGMHDRSSGTYLVQQVLKVFPHPEFLSHNPKKSDSDIGLMKLKGTIIYTSFANPICIPYLTTPLLWNTLRKGLDVLISGWGHTITKSKKTSGTAIHLQKGNAHIEHHYECIKAFSAHYYNQSNTLCLGKRTKDSLLCSGDSGGPVVPRILLPKKESIVFPVVIGIVSFGNKYCYGPDVLTKVESYADWINKWTMKL